MKNTKFTGDIYNLKWVLPLLAQLSKTFQRGSLNFSHVILAIAYNRAKLQAISESREPLEQLRIDLHSEGRLGECQLTLSENQEKELERLLIQYTAALRDNINARFEEAFPIVGSF